MSKKRLIVDLGYPRTASRSVCRAFNLMGFKSIHGPSPDDFVAWRHAMLLGDVEPIRHLFEQNEYIGQTAPHLFESVVHHFPEALFVLPIRKPDDWLGSVSRWVAQYKDNIEPEEAKAALDPKFIEPRRNRSLWRQCLFGSVRFQPNLWLRRYLNHCHDVAEDFDEIEPGPCLLIDVFQDDDPWQTLFDFLEAHEVDYDLPNAEFPHIRRGNKDDKGSRPQRRHRK